MKSFILSSKTVAEHLPCSVPFSDMLQVGETIALLSVSISVASGSDPTPSNVLYGAPTTDSTNTIAIFSLGNGLVGVTYLVSVQVTGSSLTIAVKEAYLSVLADNPF